MNENELTRRLLAEGYKPEDTPPGMCAYAAHEGGWTYDIATLRSMIYETPCGLLAKGDHFTNGYMSYGGKRQSCDLLSGVYIRTLSAYAPGSSAAPYELPWHLLGHCAPMRLSPDEAPVCL